MASAVDITSSFIGGAPPAELGDVVKAIQTLTDRPDLAELRPAFERYHEEKMVAVKLPGTRDLVRPTD
jgi:hypothetical protein